MPWAGTYMKPDSFANFLRKNNNLPSKSSGQLSDFLLLERSAARASTVGGGRRREKRRVEMKAAGGEAQSGRRSFLTLEEAGLVEMSGLSSHEKFLCRLTISSLNLLQVISEQEGCPIEELNAGKICDWFVKDRVKREQNIESAVLQWDESDFQI